MTVVEVIREIDSLDGSTVRVQGYLGRCTGYDCNLFVDEQGSDQWDNYIADIIRRKESSAVEPPMLGIGSDNDFDRKAEPLNYRYVVITGVVTNRCRYQGKPACTDRSTDLRPISIEALAWPDVSQGGAVQ